jgi:DNA-binding beta-propeller fold protein YncE
MNPARMRFLGRRLLPLAVVAAVLLAPAGASAADQIFWTNAGAGTVMTAELDGAGAHALYSGQAEPQGVGLDPVHGKLYWADTEDGTIRAGNLDGSGSATTLYSGQGSPRGLDVDPASGKLYWANDAGQIQVGNLDGSGTPTTLYEGQAGAWGVAIDPALGKLYWAMTGSQQIRSGNLDGSGTPAIVWDGESLPAGIAIDPATQTLYWGAGGNIRRGKADGSGRVTNIFEGQGTPIGLALDPSAGTIFWTDYGGNDLRSGNLAGGGATTVLGGQSTPTMPALLRAPQPEGAPQITGGARAGQQMHCSAGRWGGDVPGAFLYRAATGSAVQWLKSGTPIGGATESVYTPTESGSYSCEVTLSNQAGSQTQASAPHTVLGPLPECPERELVAGAGNPTPLQLQCTNAPTSYEIVAGPAHGTISSFDAVAGTLEYTAAAGYAGTDSFTYRATNAGSTSLTATVEISVPAPPRCRELAESAAEGRPLAVQLVCDGDGPLAYAVTSDPAHGSLSLVDPATGTLEYIPAPGYVGDDSFTYRAANISGDSGPATVRIAVHAPPVCHDLAHATPQGQPLALRLDCSDGGGPLTFAIVSAPAHGTLSDFDPATGALTYTPAPGYSGEDDFLYRASGIGGESAVAIARISVAAPPPPCDPRRDDACKPPATPPPPAPSNLFSLGKAKADARKGTASLSVTVPGPGTLRVTGKAVRTRTVQAGGAGTLVLPVAPKASAKRALRTHGKARISVSVTFTPTGGAPRTARKTIVLRAPRR